MNILSEYNFDICDDIIKNIYFFNTKSKISYFYPAKFYF